MINGELGHRGLRAGSPGSRERDGKEAIAFRGDSGIAQRVACCTNRQYLTKPPMSSATLALPILAKKVINHSLRFTLVLLLFNSTISRSSSCNVSRAFSMLAPRRTPHLCCSRHRIKLENSLWYFRSLISRASQTWHLLSTLLI